MAQAVARGRSGGQGGYSFVEMMIAMAVAVIVGVGIYGIFAYQRRAAESERIVNELQTGCRFAMDQIKRELSLAGYRAQDTVRPVKLADPNGIAFEYWDERAGFNAPFTPAFAAPSTPGYTRHALISYRIDAGKLVRTVRRWYQGTSAPTSYFMPGSSDLSESSARADFLAITDPVYRQTLATNVDGFTLQYFRQNNEPWNRDPDGDATTPPPFDEIRSVVVSLQCRSAEPSPIYKNPDLASAAAERFPVVRLQSEVRLRNVDIAANPRDTTRPAQPTNLRVWDEGLCDRLELAWDANREIDLAGYTIYYGLASGSYSNRVRIAGAPGAAGQRVRHTLAGLQATKTCDPSPATYFIRVEAFDKSANPSTRSAEISGNPSPNIAVESTSGSDTTVNPAVPPAPAAFLASTPADNQVQLSWASSPVVGLVGYRLYRGSAAGFTPAGRRVGEPGSNIIADETTLAAAAVGYLDTGLTGCVPVHYKLAAVACDNCLPIGAQAFAAAAAAPTDVGKPKAPKLVARAGFQRVILSLENPVRTAEPDFKETRIYFNPGSGSCTYPYFDTDGSLRDARLLPDSGGIFPGEGTLASVNFDDEGIPQPAKPNLALDSSYCFLAVAYDHCNNHSDASDEASDVGQQCGDCMTREDPPQPDTACYGAPPAPADLATAGCYGSLGLSWSGGDLANTDIRDLAGYRVYRCDKSSGSSCSTTSEVWSDPEWRLLTGEDAVWLSNFTDTFDKGLVEGHLYSYRVLATDCYWEQHHEKRSPGEWPDPGNDPADNASESSSPKPLSSGRILRDPSRPLVLAGMAPNSDWTRYPISEGFQHHTVLLRLRNSADATMTLRQATLAWEDDDAFLQRVALGDNSTTPLTTEAWLDPSAALTQASGGVIAFAPDAVYLNGLDDAVPAHLTFKRGDGVVSDAVNLRENRMSIGLAYRNDSTGDESCSILETVDVPLGPYVYGTTQNLPQEGTVAAPVAGDGDPAMNTILVPGEQTVEVFTNVSDSDLVGLREVRLYYYAKAGETLGAAPAPVPGARYDEDPALDNLAPYTRIDLVPVAGNLWRTPVGQGIPPRNDANVWYFIVGVDNNGNFDREPEPGRGAFQYYQQPFDICRSVPAAPVLSWSTTTGAVTLHWTAPALNTDGTSLTDLGGYTVYRVAAAGGPERLQELDAGTLTWTDAPPEMDRETYTYYVTAKDTCKQPGPNEGPESNWFTECEGAAGCTVRLATTQREPAFFHAGDGFSAELFACEKINGVSGETLFVQACSGVDSETLLLTESGDSGTFRLGAGPIATVLGGSGTAGTLDLRVSADDTVAVHGWSPTAPTGGCGSLAECSASLAVVSDACATIPAPSSPAVTVSVAGAPGSCGGNDPTVNLSWSGDDPGALLFYRVYRCSNANNKSDCQPIAGGSKISPIGTEPDLGQSGRTATDHPGRKANGNHIWYQIEAVSHNGCATAGLWKTAVSSAVVDNCP